MITMHALPYYTWPRLWFYDGDDDVYWHQKTHNDVPTIPLSFLVSDKGTDGATYENDEPEARSPLFYPVEKLVENPEFRSGFRLTRLRTW